MFHWYELIGSFAEEVSQWSMYQSIYIFNSKPLHFSKPQRILLEWKLYLIKYKSYKKN